MSGPYKAEVFDTAGGRETEQAASIIMTNPLQQAGGFIFQPQQKVRWEQQQGLAKAAPFPARLQS